MRKLLILPLLGVLVGCVFVGTGRSPVPTGPGVEPGRNGVAKVTLNQKDPLELAILGYSPDFGLMGFVVPIVPIGQWKWLTGISRDDLRVAVKAQFGATATSGEFFPRSIRIRMNSREYTASKIEPCYENETINGDLNGRIEVSPNLCIVVRFDELRPEDKPFTLTGEGLPTINYDLKRQVTGEIGP